MASLRETKDRINSVKGTLKITTVIKFVASSKLHKAQKAIEAMIPYHQALSQIFHSLKGSNVSLSSGKGGKVVIVALASNTSMCGAFNVNVLNAAKEQLDKYPDAVLYAIGRKMSEPLAKAGFNSAELFSVYGLTVAVSSWLSGVIAESWGVKRTMLAGFILVYRGTQKLESFHAPFGAVPWTSARA